MISEFLVNPKGFLGIEDDGAKRVGVGLVGMALILASIM
jgi:hypothetical protein